MITPLKIIILYNEKTKEKAYELYQTVKIAYHLNHEWNDTITTPLFSFQLLSIEKIFYLNYLNKIPDILFIPKDIDDTSIKNKDKIKIIHYYSPEEEIMLWEK